MNSDAEVPFADPARNRGEAIQGGTSQLRSRQILLLLSAACGVGVANIYYNQPLLLLIARSLRIAPAQAGQIAVATQLGYACGIFLFPSLGDAIDRRGLMTRLFTAVSVAAFASALAPNFHSLLLTSILLGLAASVTQVTLPIAPEFVAEKDRGRAVGTVMTGLLLGILLARTFSGLLGQWLGWRSVFFVAAALNLLFVPLLLRFLPSLPPARPVPYVHAIRSLWMLFTTEPLLREASLVGGCAMAAFCVFWTTLVFLLGSPHYRVGPGVVGAFGILGAVGAFTAPLAGRLIDRYGTRTVLSFAILAQSVAYLIFWSLGYRWIGLILGILLFDVGVQASQVANQTRIFGIDPHARGRINTVYMMIYFAFGAAGSAAGAFAWQHAGWPGVCGLGLSFLGLGGLRHLIGNRGATHNLSSLQQSKTLTETEM